jgi:hypothetical protein
MTDCTERQAPDVNGGLAGERREGMPKKGSA